MAAERAISPPHAGGPNLIQLRLRDVNQLFNSMDPSPFHEKDLDHDAEEFIVSWAREFPLRDPLSLVVFLRDGPPESEAQALIEQAIHHFFAYRAELTQREFRQLLRQGRASLFIGLLFLAVCVGAGELLMRAGESPLLRIAKESLLIGGWVAMWRPMEIFLYDWWPLRHRRVMFEKLSRMPVEVRRGS